jgi:glycosyltransferase involved in cell wall biosynthesis
MEIIWSCPRDVSGYSQCGRNYVLSLENSGISVIYDAPLVSRNIDGEGIDYQTKTKLDSLIRKPTGSYVRISHSIPERFEIDLNAELNIGYTVVETSKIPQKWISRCNEMDAIFTASSFCREILIRNGVSVPVFVIPHCHNPLISNDSKRFNVTNLRTFNFLFMADMTPRKGWRTLLDAFCEEFDLSEPVTLTMKVYFGGFEQEKQDECRKKIREALPNKHAPVLFYGHCYTGYISVSRFINSFECVVSPHSGEGWGLICSQAMLLREASHSHELLRQSRLHE